ncbi:MAG: Lar family restriction alleviation protein [Methanoregula sp.]|jgi:Lar family restriction alleviation protein|nr:Lar family restriction alleviation protein [Methanoregula sp.]
MNSDDLPVLKGCPLCGSTSVYLQPIDEDDEDLRGCRGFRVMCCSCTCQIGYKNTPEHAIAAWNNRPEPIPEWLKKEMIIKIAPGSRPANNETRVITETLEWVLSLHQEDVE